MGPINFGGNLGRVLVIFGLVAVVAGLLLLFGPKIPWLGRLPGDIVIKRENFSLYFPLTTCLLISVLLTLLFKIFRG